MVDTASGQQMVSFDADSCLSSGHAACVNSWVMGRVHQSMRRRGSLWRPRIRSVHVSTTGGITTSGKPLAMYGADDPPYGKSRVNCQVPRPACPSPPTARLTRRLADPSRTHFTNPTLTKPCKSDACRFQTGAANLWPTIRPFLNRRVAYHQDFAKDTNCLTFCKSLIWLPSSLSVFVFESTPAG